MKICLRTVSKSYRTRETRYKKNLEHIFKIDFLSHICDTLRINLKNILLKYPSGLPYVLQLFLDFGQDSFGDFTHLNLNSAVNVVALVTTLGCLDLIVV
jgi:hypothetical protein